jgi:hypothetical protein
LHDFLTHFPEGGSRSELLTFSILSCNLEKFFSNY